MGWRAIGTGGGGSGYFKLTPGDKKMVHILLKVGEEPYTFSQHYFKAMNKGAVCPGAADGCPACASKIKELRPRQQHAFPIYSYAEKDARLWIASETVADQIKAYWDAYGGTLENYDLSVTRIGSGLETKYIIAPFPTRYKEGTAKDVPEAESILAPATNADIESLLAGIDPSTEADSQADAPPGATAKAPASDPWGEQAPPATNDAAPVETPAAGDNWGNEAPQATPPATPPAATTATKTKAAPAANDRTTLMKKVLHKFATHPKLKAKGAKEKFMAKNAPGKKTISQASVIELTAMLKILTA